MKTVIMTCLLSALALWVLAPERKLDDKLLPPPAPVAIKPGIYAVTGDGYTGAATLTRYGDGWMLASMTIPTGGQGAAPVIGLGLEHEGHLVIGWSYQGVPGVTVLRIERGKLAGTWMGGSGERHRETLEFLREMR